MGLGLRGICLYTQGANISTLIGYPHITVILQGHYQATRLPWGLLEHGEVGRLDGLVTHKITLKTGQGQARGWKSVFYCLYGCHCSPYH